MYIVQEELFEPDMLIPELPQEPECELHPNHCSYCGHCGIARKEEQ